ncbi:MAG: DUF6666 family protein [Pirellulales bacterium]
MKFTHRHSQFLVVARVKLALIVGLALTVVGAAPALAQTARRYSMVSPPSGVNGNQGNVLRTSYGAPAMRAVPPVHVGFVPKHEQWAASHGWRKADPIEGEEVLPGMQSPSVLRSGEVVDGDVVWQTEPGEPPVWDGRYSSDDMCSADFCEEALRTWQVMGGVAGYTGPVNRGAEGSFGLYEAVNFGAPIPLGIPTEIGWQLGARLTQANLSGSEFTLESRNQIFLTTAVFHRVDRGLQWVIGVDWLHENWYFEGDFMQVRGELSWKAECEREFGLVFAAGTTPLTATSTFNPGPPTTAQETWQSTDWYAGFYRVRFGECAENHVRAFAGFTSQSDGLLGADASMQINEHWALQSGFTFLIPAEHSGLGLEAGHAQESWNLFTGVVWTPGCSSRERGYFAPLLNVADNGSFFVDRR